MANMLDDGTPSPFPCPGADLPLVPVLGNTCLTRVIYSKKKWSLVCFICKSSAMVGVGFMVDEESIVFVKVTENVSFYLFPFLFPPIPG
jgi:hypothetical protein